VAQRIFLTYFDENGAVVSNFLRCPGAKLLLPKTVVKNRQCAEGYGNFLRCPGAKLLLPKTVVKNRQCAEGYGFSISCFCDETHT